MSTENSLKIYTQLEEMIFCSHDISNYEIADILSLK